MALFKRLPAPGAVDGAVGRGLGAPDVPRGGADLRTGLARREAARFGGVGARFQVAAVSSRLRWGLGASGVTLGVQVGSGTSAGGSDLDKEIAEFTIECYRRWKR